MKKKTLIAIIVVVSLLVLFVLFCRFGLKIGNWQYDSYNEFSKNSYSRFSIVIPDGATDQRFFYRNILLSRYSICAFTLDKDSYDAYMDELVKEYRLEGDAEDELFNKYSYPKWYKMKVRDAANIDYELDRFPTHLLFEKVIDDDINDYDIIVYDPVGTGTFECGIVAKPDTGRVVVYSKGNVR